MEFVLVLHLKAIIMGGWSLNDVMVLHIMTYGRRSVGFGVGCSFWRGLLECMSGFAGVGNLC